MSMQIAWSWLDSFITIFANSGKFFEFKVFVKLLMCKLGKSSFIRCWSSSEVYNDKAIPWVEGISLTWP